MMVTDKQFAEKIHMEIHAVRRIPNYKPTIMEKNISRFVLEHFKDCEECKEIKQQIDNQPKKKGFFKKLGDLADAG